MPSLSFGIVLNGKFFSDRIRKVVPGVANGIYCLDKNADDIWSTLALADLTEATKFFKKSNKFSVVRGVSFHHGFIPDNVVLFKTIPIGVLDGQFEEFEYIETLIGEFGCYYLQTLATQETYALMDLKECVDKNNNINTLKNLTPPMRVVYSFHCLEKIRIQEEKDRAEQAKRDREPPQVIRKRLEDSGAVVHSITKKRHGFEVVWELMGHTISTIVGNNYNVLEAGFCTSGGDTSQSVTSIPNLLKSYVEDGSYIHLTRSVN